MRVLFLFLLSLYSRITWVSAADSQACPNPIVYKPVPMNLTGAMVDGPTPDPLHNDGMLGNLPGAAGWCTDPDIEKCPNPAGFQRGVYFPDNNPPFCLTISGVRNHMVEIMVEPLASGNKVCILDTDANSVSNIGVPLVNQCASSATRACFVGPNGADARDTLTISISCSDQASCPTSDVEFWYRVRVSNVDFVNGGASGAASAANSAITSPEMWCQMIAASAKYPSQLAAANTNLATGATSAPTSPTRPPNQAPTTTTHALGMLVTIMLALLLKA